MKKSKLFLSLLSLSFLLVIASCSKNDSNENNTDDNSQASVHTDDGNGFDNEMNVITTDVTTAIEANGTMSGRFMGTDGVLGCNVSAVVNTSTNPMTITVTYSGADCSGAITRTGTVVASMPQGTQWKNAGAAITITATNLVVTRVRDGRSITINGSYVHTNVSGGLLINLATLGTITRTVTSAGINVTFSAGGQRSWRVARQHTYTYANNIATLTITGTHTEGNQAGVIAWGTNRFGQTFTTAVTTPLVFKSDCAFRLGAGVVVHTTPRFTATTTFGLNASGVATGCPGTGAYYYKLDWTTAGGYTGSLIAPY